jgi:hypothetical protein
MNHIFWGPTLRSKTYELVLSFSRLILAHLPRNKYDLDDSEFFMKLGYRRAIIRLKARDVETNGKSQHILAYSHFGSHLYAVLNV